jgi:hypothetical protein
MGEGKAWPGKIRRGKYAVAVGRRERQRREAKWGIIIAALGEAEQKTAESAEGGLRVVTVS